MAAATTIDLEFESEVYALLLDESDNLSVRSEGMQDNKQSKNATDSSSKGANGTAAKKGHSTVTLQDSNVSAERKRTLALEDKHRADRESKRQRNSPNLLPQKDLVRDANAPYDVLHQDKKNIAEGVWLADIGVVELRTVRGNFWRIMGYTKQSQQLLNPEEALLLVEKSQLLVRSNVGDPVTGLSVDVALTKRVPHIPTQHFYQEVLQFVPQACVLAYVKLKSLEYITMRHNRNNGNDTYPLRAFSCDADVYDHMRAHPNQGILESLVSFDIYSNVTGWTKKMHLDKDSVKKPHGHVVVQTGDWTLNSRLVMHLLTAARGVPVLFAAVMPTGNLIIEEFTDAATSLNWDNKYAIDITYQSKVTMDTLVVHEEKKKKQIKKDNETEENGEEGGDEEDGDVDGCVEEDEDEGDEEEDGDDEEDEGAEEEEDEDEEEEEEEDDDL